LEIILATAFAEDLQDITNSKQQQLSITPAHNIYKILRSTGSQQELTSQVFHTTIIFLVMKTLEDEWYNCYKGLLITSWIRFLLLSWQGTQQVDQAEKLDW